MRLFLLRAALHAPPKPRVGRIVETRHLNEGFQAEYGKLGSVSGLIAVRVIFLLVRADSGRRSSSPKTEMPAISSLGHLREELPFSIREHIKCRRWRTRAHRCFRRLSVANSRSSSTNIRFRSFCFHNTDLVILEEGQSSRFAPWQK
jgi:hypothetical protein